MNGLRFAEYKTYNEAEIMALYSSVGWSNYTNNPAMLRKAYKNSLYVLAAYADGKLGGYSVLSVMALLWFFCRI